MMSEFNQSSEKTEAPARQAQPSPKKPLPWHSRPILLGFSAPYLGAGALVLAVAAWVLFAPEGKPTVNELAFGDSSGYQPAPSRFNTPAHEPALAPARSSEPMVAQVQTGPSSEQVLSQLSTQLSGSVQAVQEHSDANRLAIERLSETVKSQMSEVANLKQQLKELEVQVSMASSRPARQVEAIGQIQLPKAPKRTTVPASNPEVANMRVSAVQRGMAWVQWQDKTWAVQVGDRLGSVVITDINSAAREVGTTGGVLR